MSGCSFDQARRYDATCIAQFTQNRTTQKHDDLSDHVMDRKFLLAIHIKSFKRSMNSIQDLP